jgi:rhodanese-related sulfurtransferase
MNPTINREELRQKIERKEPFTLVEALPEPKYRQQHLPGAINLPSDWVKELAPRMLPDKGAEIVVYCGGPT